MRTSLWPEIWSSYRSQGHPVDSHTRVVWYMLYLYRIEVVVFNGKFIYFFNDVADPLWEKGDLVAYNFLKGIVTTYIRRAWCLNIRSWRSRNAVFSLIDHWLRVCLELFCFWDNTLSSRRKITLIIVDSISCQLWRLQIAHNTVHRQNQDRWNMDPSE